MCDVVVLLVAECWGYLARGTLKHCGGRCMRDLRGDDRRGHDGREGHEREGARRGPPGIASRSRRAGWRVGGMGEKFGDREMVGKVWNIIGCTAVEERGPLGKHVYGGGHDVPLDWTCSR